MNHQVERKLVSPLPDRRVQQLRQVVDQFLHFGAVRVKIGDHLSGSFVIMRLTSGLRYFLSINAFLYSADRSQDKERVFQRPIVVRGIVTSELFQVANLVFVIVAFGNVRFDDRAKVVFRKNVMQLCVRELLSEKCLGTAFQFG